MPSRVARAVHTHVVATSGLKTPANKSRASQAAKRLGDHGGGAVQITLRDPGADRPGEPVLERSLMQPHWGQEQLPRGGVREQALVGAVNSEDAFNQSRDDERASPAPSFRHEYQEWVDEVELCFDRDTPKRGIDGVIELLAEVVEQERMGQPVVALYRWI